MSKPRRVAFVQVGSFSGTNSSVLELLERDFPEFEVDVFDVGKSRLFRRAKTSPTLLYHAYKEYGKGLLNPSKRPIANTALRTPYAADRIRKFITRKLAARSYAFTFQTQSLFDASIPGTPHFLYTDHTHLANLTYPAFDRRKLLSNGWIECERSIYRNATVNLTMSSNISHSIVHQYGCDPSQVECVYAGTNVRFPKTVSSNDARYSAKNILFVGVDWERKGGPQLVEAFKRVLQVYPEATLTIVGCSPTVDVKNVQVVGRVPLAEVSKYYQQATVFCLPTRLEPFGIVFLEAFAHKLPVVATRIGAIPDFVAEGESGYLVEDGDIELLAQRLTGLLGDPKRCKLFGEAGRRLVQDRYTWETTGRRIRDVIGRFVNLTESRSERVLQHVEPGAAYQDVLVEGPDDAQGGVAPQAGYRSPTSHGEFRR
jgi:glycosyltransferase involved in cell wall biosynthesis